MNNPDDRDQPPTYTVDRFQAHPDVLYSLDAAAHLAGISRRSLLIYCRAGLVQPVFQPPYGVMTFREESIHAVRRIEHVRAVHDLDVACLKAIFDLLAEVERLRDEVRFLRER